MTFLVSIETPTCGSYALGFVEVNNELKQKSYRKRPKEKL